MEGSIFDLQEIWQSIVTRARESEESTGFADYLEKTYPDPKLEDFAFYKEYLSLFVLNEELYGKEFLNDCDLSADECLLLMKLAAASFSSTYELAYLPDEDKLELTFHVTSGDQKITKKLQELWSFQIDTMYRIYLEEQLHLEYSFSDEEFGLDEERNTMLAVFEKQVARCVDELHGTVSGRSGLKSIEDKLDDLLNS